MRVFVTSLVLLLIAGCKENQKSDGTVKEVEDNSRPREIMSIPVAVEKAEAYMVTNSQTLFNAAVSSVVISAFAIGDNYTLTAETKDLTDCKTASITIGKSVTTFSANDIFENNSPGPCSARDPSKNTFMDALNKSEDFTLQTIFSRSSQKKNTFKMLDTADQGGAYAFTYSKADPTDSKSLCQIFLTVTKDKSSNEITWKKPGCKDSDFIGVKDVAHGYLSLEPAIADAKKYMQSVAAPGMDFEVVSFADEGDNYLITIQSREKPKTPEEQIARKTETNFYACDLEISIDKSNTRNPQTNKNQHCANKERKEEIVTFNEALTLARSTASLKGASSYAITKITTDNRSESFLGFAKANFLVYKFTFSSGGGGGSCSGTVVIDSKRSVNISADFPGCSPH